MPATANLNGTTTDDGLPIGSTLTITWTQVSGPETVAFANPNTAITTASFSAIGTYILRLTADDGQLPASDQVTITVNPANQPPIVSAGPDQTITLPGTASLNGTVSDDGLPAGSTLSISWSKVSGPGTVIFTNASTWPATMCCG